MRKRSEMGLGGGRKRRTRQVLKSSMNEKDWPVGQQIAAQESGWYSFRAHALADSVIHPTSCSWFADPAPSYQGPIDEPTPALCPLTEPQSSRAEKGTAFPKPQTFDQYHHNICLIHLLPLVIFSFRLIHFSLKCIYWKRKLNFTSINRKQVALSKRREQP